jgi:histidinol-phosphatase
MPLIGTLIGVLKNGKPVVGVVHFPALQETLYAAEGLRCWYRTNGNDPVQIRVSKDVSLKEATITTTGIHRSDVLAKKGTIPYRLSQAARKAKKIRFGGDCYLYSLLCQGRTHAVIEPIMNPWDVAALIPCVEEAGGIVSTLGGDEDNIVFGGSLPTSCHRTLHSELLETLQPTLTPL